MAEIWMLFLVFGHSASENKTAELVYQAIARIQADLNDVNMFHTGPWKRVR